MAKKAMCMLKHFKLQRSSVYQQPMLYSWELPLQGVLAHIVLSPFGGARHLCLGGDDHAVQCIIDLCLQLPVRLRLCSQSSIHVT